ncbi:MAG: hypothetical protein AAB481_00860 [Patescibacteria group bacterium]
MKKKHRDLAKPVTVGDLDDLASQIITAVSKETTRIEGKVDVLDQKVNALDQKVTMLDKKVDKLDYDVSDIRRRVIDLEVDTVPRKDFQDLKFLVATHRHP